jgi:hypothetical protein
MRGEASLQGIPEGGKLGAEATPGQLRQHVRIGGTANQSVEHRPSGGTKHPGGQTEESLMPASWSTLSRRWISLVRSSILKPYGSGLSSSTPGSLSAARSWDAPARAQQAGRSTPRPEHRSSYRGRSLEVAGV